jgi:hypothetical protein
VRGWTVTLVKDGIGVEDVVELVAEAEDVTVSTVTPQHEQALLYREVPEQALAYLGTAVGLIVVCLEQVRV